MKQWFLLNFLWFLKVWRNTCIIFGNIDSIIKISIGGELQWNAFKYNKTVLLLCFLHFPQNLKSYLWIISCSIDAIFNMNKILPFNLDKVVSSICAICCSWSWKDDHQNTRKHFLLHCYLWQISVNRDNEESERNCFPQFWCDLCISASCFWYNPV